MESAEHAVVVTFKTKAVVDYIFSLCAAHEFPPEVRYSALELFDAFMKAEASKAYETFAREKSDWPKYVKALQSRVMLRATSCVQVASKLTSTRTERVINIDAVERIHEFRFDRDTILRSELKILTAFDFRLSVVTPLPSLEALIELVRGRLLASTDSHVRAAALAPSHYARHFTARDTSYGPLRSVSPKGDTGALTTPRRILSLVTVGKEKNRPADVASIDVFHRLCYLFLDRAMYLSFEDGEIAALVNNPQKYKVLAAAVVATSAFMSVSAALWTVTRIVSEEAREPSDRITDLMSKFFASVVSYGSAA